MDTHRDDEDGERFSGLGVGVPVEEQAHPTEEVLHAVVQPVEDLQPPLQIGDQARRVWKRCSGRLGSLVLRREGRGKIDAPNMPDVLPRLSLTRWRA